MAKPKHTISRQEMLTAWRKYYVTLPTKQVLSETEGNIDALRRKMLGHWGRRNLYPDMSIEDYRGLLSARGQAYGVHGQLRAELKRSSEYEH